jgi:hypothetical protein
MKWIYLTDVWDPTHTHGGIGGEAGLRNLLQQRGEEGWELVAVTKEIRFRFFFKQPG